MTQLHVGAGTTRGALTVFPVWTDYTGPRGYDIKHDAIRVDERPGGASVPTLHVTNSGRRPVALFEGEILEGGWQNRMIARSLIVPAAGDLEAEVVCVEAGRWHGGDAHALRGHRASNRVRAGLRQVAPERDRQAEVWSRIAELDARLGPTATGSYVEQADRAAATVKQAVAGIGALAGQAGMVIAISGQPVAVEAFDNPWTYRAHHRSILAAAAMDALGQPAIPTPSRRARRFVDRVARVRRTSVAPAGLGATRSGRDEHADLTELFLDRHAVHLVATSRRHGLTKAAV